MADFKRKPMAAELTAALKTGVKDIPSAIVEQSIDGAVDTRAKAPAAPKTVQVNFNVTEEFADLIAELAQEAGSTRRLMARTFRDMGHKVPVADLNPHDNRRRLRKNEV